MQLSAEQEFLQRCYGFLQGDAVLYNIKGFSKGAVPIGQRCVWGGFGTGDDALRELLKTV
jgi:hypothetical protein